MRNPAISIPLAALWLAGIFCVSVLLQGTATPPTMWHGVMPANPAPHTHTMCGGSVDTATTMAGYLRLHSVPYPEMFARVAWGETNFGTQGVGLMGNLFGMRCHDRDTQCGCAYGYGIYLSHVDAICDLADWCMMAPPLEGETGYQYLARRGWQPCELMPGYIAYLETLVFADTIRWAPNL